MMDDLEKERDALRAENERLKVLRAECDGWFLDAQARFATYEAEIKRLKAALDECDGAG